MSGVRWAYALSQLVAPGMVEAKAGLIVNISSAGGIFYFCGVPYGVMHAALDKLGADVATELKGTGVTCVTVWPGGAVTERTSFPGGETPAFTGRAVAALAAAGAEDLAGEEREGPPDVRARRRVRLRRRDGRAPGGRHGREGHAERGLQDPALRPAARWGTTRSRTTRG